MSGDVRRTASQASSVIMTVRLELTWLTASSHTQIVLLQIQLIKILPDKNTGKPFNFTTCKTYNRTDKFQFVQQPLLVAIIITLQPEQLKTNYSCH